MARLERPDQLLAGRWKWTVDKLDRHLQRGCSIGDIDGHLESNGRHLFIEGKHWEQSQQPRLDEANGQMRALRSLVGHGHTVWILYGVAHGMDHAAGDPLFMCDLLDDDWIDLTPLPSEHRRAYLAMRLGLWQAAADGRLMPDGMTRDRLESWRLKAVRARVAS